jgi:hypothetical protein
MSAKVTCIHPQPGCRFHYSLVLELEPLGTTGQGAVGVLCFVALMGAYVKAFIPSSLDSDAEINPHADCYNHPHARKEVSSHGFALAFVQVTTP